ncbi:hypothetical protein ACFFJY_09410 [Fictibacillus aquaticus]|uniref:Uncharacterized protein n=1 Tax=Fictibacillus aquaticus TaxID=2021314 RepID=A0A235FAX5_9BACL|nr:hypothetical protein [Fictibacillus aquaticus]OYD58490.1 hypothetical protein CGZ90_00895 [Fictibacillus aquaticus]
MPGAEVKVAQEIAASQNAWAVLFIILFFGVLWGFKQHTQKQEALHTDRQNKLDQIHQESRQEARDREKALLVVIERQNETLDKQGESLEKINETQERIHLRLDKLEARFDSAMDFKHRNFIEMKPEHFRGGQS